MENSESERLSNRELLERIREEYEEACNARSQGPKVPPWMWSQVITLLIVAAGALYVTGQFNGRFEEFRTAVYQRLDMLERREERHRGPENYSPPPIISTTPR